MLLHCSKNGVDYSSIAWSATGSMDCRFPLSGPGPAPTPRSLEVRMSPLRIDYRWMVLIWLGAATVATFAAIAHALLEHNQWTMF